MTYRLSTRDVIRGRVNYNDTLHMTYAAARDAVRRDLVLLGLRHALRWLNDETAHDVDSSDPRSVNAFLNSPLSITRFFIQLLDYDRLDEAGRDLLESCRNGRAYEWPIDPDEEVALLLLAANDGEVVFEFRIAES